MTFKNFQAGSRKPNMVDFGLFPSSRDLSWISNNTGSFTPTINSVSYSTTPSFDIANGRLQRITLTGDVTSSTFTQSGGTPEVGSIFWLQVIQDATGGRIFTFPSTVRNQGGFSVGTDANTMTTMQFQYRASGWDFITPPVEGPAS